MKCPRAEELWGDLIEGSLPEPLRRDLEEHLRSCPACPGLLSEFREVVRALSELPRPQPSSELFERILAATRPHVASLRRTPPISFPAVPLPRWSNWILGSAAAAFILVLVLRPPSAVATLGERLNVWTHQAYSTGLRLYRGSERLIDELNVLRMTVGVAFEDRLDRLNQRLKDLEEARRKRDEDPEKSSRLSPLSRLSKNLVPFQLFGPEQACQELKPDCHATLRSSAEQVGTAPADTESVETRSWT